MRKKKRQEKAGVDPFALDGETTSWVCPKCRTQNHTTPSLYMDESKKKFHGPWCEACGTVKRGVKLNEDEQERHAAFVDVIEEREGFVRVNRTGVKEVFLEDHAVKKKGDTNEVVVRSTEG